MNNDGRTREEMVEDDRVIVPITVPEDPAESGGEKSEALPEMDAEAYRERWVRAAADLENLRKRTTREIELVRRTERESVLRAFLDVVDNLERAIDAHDSENDQWVEGVEAVRQQMLDVLKQFGVEPYDAMGEEFDPKRHEAVARVSLPGVPEGKIVEVTQAGYEIGDDTTLRPAKVIVAHDDEG